MKLTKESKTQHTKWERTGSWSGGYRSTDDASIYVPQRLRKIDWHRDLNGSVQPYRINESNCCEKVRMHKELNGHLEEEWNKSNGLISTRLTRSIRSFGCCVQCKTFHGIYQGKVWERRYCGCIENSHWTTWPRKSISTSLLMSTASMWLRTIRYSIDSIIFLIRSVRAAHITCINDNIWTGNLCGNSQLRKLFLKSENSMGGRYFLNLPTRSFVIECSPSPAVSIVQYVMAWNREHLKTLQQHIADTEAIRISGIISRSGHVDTIYLPRRIDGCKGLESIEYFARLERSNHFRIFWTFSSLFLLQRLNRSISNSRLLTEISGFDSVDDESIDLKFWADVKLSDWTSLIHPRMRNILFLEHQRPTQQIYMNRYAYQLYYLSARSSWIDFEREEWTRSSQPP